MMERAAQQDQQVGPQGVSAPGVVVAQVVV